MQFWPREGQEFEWANLQKLNAQEVALGGGGGGVCGGKGRLKL